MFEVSYFQEAKLLIDEIDYFDVVYIDYEMENMTAFEFLKKLKWVNTLESSLLNMIILFIKA